MARSIADIRKLFPYNDDCVELQKTIDKLINEKSYYALRLNSGEISVLDNRLSELNSFFNKITCEMVIGNKKLEQVSEIANKYQEIDKIRIESESIKERNKRVYIGIGIVLAGAGIILITNRK
jgi:uncharacterized coiled-coil DUF342 family protein